MANENTDTNLWEQRSYSGWKRMSSVLISSQQNFEQEEKIENIKNLSLATQDVNWWSTCMFQWTNKRAKRDGMLLCGWSNKCGYHSLTV